MAMIQHPGQATFALWEARRFAVLADPSDAVFVVFETP
jgi:hypothetical protein